MHIVSFLKSDHLARSGGRLNFSKNTDFGISDFHLCARRFLKNCVAEFNETRHNYYIEDVVDIRCSIFKIGSISALWWNTELDKYTDFGTSDFHLCARRFLKNCTAEFNEIRHNNYIEAVVD